MMPRILLAQGHKGKIQQVNESFGLLLLKFIYKFYFYVLYR
jgi:hypothetical protein